MTLAADLGLWLLASHPVGTTACFVSVPLSHIGRTGPSSYCSTVNLNLDVAYALTLDYDAHVLRELFELLPRSVTERISASLTSPFIEPGIVELDQSFHATVTARLSKPIHSGEETYAPLQVVALERAGEGDDMFSFSIGPQPATKKKKSSERVPPSSNRSLEIALPDVLYILETDERILVPSPAAGDWPLIVAATAAALCAHPFRPRDSGARLALLATDRGHVEGLSCWLAIVGPGAMAVLGKLRAYLESIEAPTYMESASPMACGFRPFLVQDRERCSLVMSDRDDLLTEWNLGLIEDSDSMDTTAGLTAIAEAVAARFAQCGLTTRNCRRDGNQFSISA